ncbi:MAG: hypothetical protein ABI443_14125 [Chthoniobacterales bacterium]
MKNAFRWVLLLLVTTISLATFEVHAQEAPSWPRTLSSSSGAISIYEPQVDSFNQSTLTAHAAISLTPSGQNAPIFGAIWFTANVVTNRENRTVQILNLQITNSRFPQADESLLPAVNQAIVQDATTAQPNISLDNLLASLSRTQKETTAASNLNSAPPQIIFTSYPAILVMIDGQPQLSPVPNSPLMRIVNTPFFIVFDPSTKTYYLHGAAQWVSATNITGPWETATNVPAPVTSYSKSEEAVANAKNPESSPQDTADAQSAYISQGAPKIIVVTQPAELIQTSGTEQFSSIPGTSLLYITNTDSNVFMDINSQQLYILLSGRWYSASSQSGPWTFTASNQLPADFAKIPAGSPKASVLASIAGTLAANNALLDASVPQTAVVKPNAPGPDVKYDGDPKFESIQGTAMQYASNTSHSVIKVENKYYCCADGIWFAGEDAVGPWAVAPSVPQVIYTIPPTCPVYNVTYCYVYNSTPDAIYCGYLPGYVGSYPYEGTVVYGTGWPYQPWSGSVYIPRPVTWGFGAVYNPVACGWGFGVGSGVGFGFGVGWNSGWWGAGGYHPAYWNNRNWNHENWNNNGNWNHSGNSYTSNTYNTTNNNIYNHSSNTNRIVQNNSNNNNVNANKIQNRNTDNTNKTTTANKIAARSNHPNETRQNTNENRQNLNNPVNSNHTDEARSHGNIYAGNDGNVYRHSMNGWERHSNTDNSWHSSKEWSDRDNFEHNVQPSLNHDASSRYSSNRSYGRNESRSENRESHNEGDHSRNSGESHRSSGGSRGGGRR